MKDTAIQWADHTFNPWEGCTKVAPECKNCYAETLVDKRFGRAKWGKGQPRRRTSENLWKQPLAWNKKPWRCDNCGLFFTLACPNCYTSAGSTGTHRVRVFCLSLGDWLDEEVPIEWFADLMILAHRCDNLDFLFLSKRPQNWKRRIFEAIAELYKRDADTELVRSWLKLWLEFNKPPHNIWIGVSAGADQKAALDIPAKIHFLSCEPMLHALDTKHAAGFDWIIFGGESGKNARDLNVEWIREGVAFCRSNGVAPFVKQLGARPYWNGLMGNFATSAECRYRLKDSHGGDMEEWPEDLRVREFPSLI
jgi:protein gp37